MSIQLLAYVSAENTSAAASAQYSIKESPSTHRSDSAEIFTEFFQQNANICIWEREPNAELSPYIQQLRQQNTTLIRSVDLENVSQTLGYLLPDFSIPALDLSKSAFIKDVSMLIDMVCCLFDCESVGLRLTVLNRAMCPKFHTDKVSGRLICTYSGQATEWLNSEYPQLTSSELIASYANASSSEDNSKASSFAPRANSAKASDVLLLKGEAWPGNEHNGIVHRSPSVGSDEARLLLTIDPK